MAQTSVSALVAQPLTPTKLSLIPMMVLKSGGEGHISRSWAALCREQWTIPLQACVLWQTVGSWAWYSSPETNNTFLQHERCSLGHVLLWNEADIYRDTDVILNVHIMAMIALWKDTKCGGPQSTMVGVTNHYSRIHRKMCFGTCAWIREHWNIFGQKKQRGENAIFFNKNNRQHQ